MIGADGPLRVALLSYRSKPHCGGQGIYVRHLSRELTALGHHVEVFSGQPYPDLEPGPELRELPSLDLYREPDPFRTPGLREYRDWIDVLEVAMMWTAAFPEPMTFSLRALRALRARRGDFDVVHDNQVLAYGMLGLGRLGLPVVTSIHHPISVDRRIELEAARGLSRLSKRRWYGFVRMQGRVARRCGPIMTGSQSSADDILRDFRVPADRVQVVPLGVDTRLFHPREAPRVPGRILAVASADSPVKGVGTLLRAVSKLVTERDVHLIVVGRPAPGGPTEKLVAELALGEQGPLRHRHQRHRAGRAGGQRGDRGGAVAVRGVLAARGGAHGVRHPAGGQPHRCAARGDRGRRPAGRAGRRAGAGGGAAPAARHPGRAGPAVRRRAGPGRGAVRLAGRGGGDRRAVPAGDRGRAAKEPGPADGGFRPPAAAAGRAGP